MRLMTDPDIKRSIANVKNSLAVEGLQMNRIGIVNGRKYLRGQISSQEAIENITKYILTKNRK